MSEINKEELLEAIDNYSLYTQSQRRVLRTLIEVEIGNKATIDVLTLSDVSATTPTVAYKTIKLLERDNVLEILPSANNKINIFMLRIERLEEMKQAAHKLNKIRQNKTK